MVSDFCDGPGRATMSTIPSPVPASVLVDRELARRKKLGGIQQKWNILTGCREIDEYVLLGGFERGSVVGVSSEDDEMGLLIGLQTVAHLLVTATLEMIRNQNDHRCKTTTFSYMYPRVTIITMLPVNVLVPKLRQVLVNQLAAGLSSGGGGGGLQNINALVKQCLRGISISMVFDVEGLREVLGEIGGSSSHSVDEEQGQQQEKKQEQEKDQEKEHLLLQDGPTSKGDPVEAETEAVQREPVVPIPIPTPVPIRSPAKPQPVKSRSKTEILDSEDEDEDEDKDEDEDEDEADGEVEDTGNTTDMSSELSSPAASLPDEFEEYEKLLQDNTPAPKQDEDIPETTTGSGTINDDSQTQPQIDNMENPTEEIGGNSDNTRQTQPPPENKESEPFVDTNTQPRPPAMAENIKPPTNIDVQPSAPPPVLPDMILITHMSSLLNGLFTGRDKPAAHATMTLLSSQLRQLARITPPPLIVILNSTTTSTSSSFASTSGAMTGENNPNSNNLGEQWPASREQHQQPTTDPTLRSIFSHQQGGSYSKTKPSFGTVFAQLLDLHLLCTRIPRRQGQRQTDPGPTRGGLGIGRAEPPISTARAGAGVGGISSPSHRFAWVVEVLLDERGVYEFDDGVGVDGGTIGEEMSSLETQIQIRRRCREQRWGAVEVEEGGGRIVDVVI